MRAIRAKRKSEGYKEVRIVIPEEYKKLLDQFSRNTRLSFSEFICYVLGCIEERDLPDIDRPIDFQKK